MFKKSSTDLKTTIKSKAALWPASLSMRFPPPLPKHRGKHPPPRSGRAEEDSSADEDRRERIWRGGSSCEPAWPRRRASFHVFIPEVRAVAAFESSFPKRSAKTRVFKRAASPRCTRRGGEAPRCCLHEPQSHPCKTRGVSDRAQAGEEMIHAIKDAVGLMEPVKGTWPRWNFQSSEKERFPRLEPLGWPLHCFGPYQISIIQKLKTPATHVLLKHV